MIRSQHSRDQDKLPKTGSTLTNNFSYLWCITFVDKEIYLIVFLYSTRWPVVGRFENLKNWIFTKAQVDPMDAHTNKHICILRNCFWWKTALENAKTLVLPKYTRFSKTPNRNQLIISAYFETRFSISIHFYRGKC